MILTAEQKKVINDWIHITGFVQYVESLPETDENKQLIANVMDWRCTTEQAYKMMRPIVEAFRGTLTGGGEGGGATDPADPDVPETPENPNDDTIKEIDAFLAALDVGGDVKLGEDLTTDAALVAKGNSTIDLNGKTLTVNKDASDAYGDAFTVKSPSANVTIKGGTVIPPADHAADAAIVIVKAGKATLEDVNFETTAFPVYLNGATGYTAEVVIKSGNFVSDNEKGCAVYVQKNGKCTIEGGRFSAGKHTSNYVLNLKDDLNEGHKPTDYIEVFGGEFVNFNPADSAGEPGGHANFVADGYKVGYYSEGPDTIYVVGKTLPKNATEWTTPVEDTPADVDTAEDAPAAIAAEPAEASVAEKTSTKKTSRKKATKADDVDADSVVDPDV